MLNFTQIFKDQNFTGDEKYKKIYQCLKPLIVSKIHQYLASRGLRRTGRPITTDFNKIVDALYFITESGSQIKYVKDMYGLSPSTFKHYRQIIADNQILERVYQEAIHNYTLPDLLIADSFTVKSMRGSEGLGRNPTDRGRKGFKISIVCDVKRITHSVQVRPANRHDSKILEDNLDQITRPKILTRCLCDSGYVGKQLRDQCLKKGKKTHVLLKTDRELLSKNRNQIELLNGHIRRYRGLMIKWTKNLSTYKCMLYVALLCITCYQLYVKGKFNG
jgi:transposase